ncbi:MAG: glycosyltransferase, partial [Tepidisphaeraceae bacterium]
MRILILALRYPETLVGGYESTLYRLIQGYHRHGHKIDLMAFVPRLADKTDRESVDPWCDNVLLFEDPFVPRWWSPRRWPSILHSPDSGTLGRSSKLFVEQLRDMLAHHPPDVVQIQGYSMLQYRKHLGRIPCIAFPADCMTLALERWKRATNPWVRARLALHGAKLRRMESTYRSFYAVVFVSQPDADRARQLSPGANIVRIPIGVDTEYFAPTDQGVEPTTIAFHGEMGYPPNVEASSWFIANILPELKRRHPAVRFLVIGANPAEQMLSAARGDPNIVVTGFVPDIRPHLQSASVLVAPMQSGSGMQNKVIEGMAMAKPMVVTSLAIA